MLRSMIAARTPLLAAAICGFVSACVAPDEQTGTPEATTEQRLWTSSYSDAIWAKTALTLCGVKTSYFPAGHDFTTEMDAIRQVMARWEAASGIRFTYQASCAPPSVVNGKKYYPEDIRVALVDNSAIGHYVADGDADCLKAFRAHACPDWPAADGSVDCAIISGGSWSNNARDQSWNHVCPYSMLLNFLVTPDDVDTTCPTCPNGMRYNSGLALHEMGHGLGMEHEFVRQDQVNGCGTVAVGGITITPPDSSSVMYYWDKDRPCYTGNMDLSDYDRLGMEFAYPIPGAPLFRPTYGMAYDGGWATFDASPIAIDWRTRGVPTANFKSFSWSKNGVKLSNGIDNLTTSGWSQDVAVTLATSFVNAWSKTRAGSASITPSAAKTTAMVLSTMPQ
jgi:hypothetical protein